MTADTPEAADEARIQSDVLKMLARDVRMHGAEITAAVSGNIVRLTGSLPSYTARKAAEHTALHVAGVQAVENDLRIVPKTPTPPSDAEIQAHIKDALLWSPDIDPSDVGILVQNGGVQLEGTVTTYAEKTAAEEIAGRVTGVQDIVDHMAVVPTQRVSDRAIAQNVQEALTLHPEMDLENIDVEVSDGLVTLAGAVPTRTLYDAALDATRYTRGVINIEDKIVIG